MYKNLLKLGASVILLLSLNSRSYSSEELKNQVYLGCIGLGIGLGYAVYKVDLYQKKYLQKSSNPTYFNSQKRQNARIGIWNEAKKKCDALKVILSIPIKWNPYLQARNNIVYLNLFNGLYKIALNVCLHASIFYRPCSSLLNFCLPKQLIPFKYCYENKGAAHELKYRISNLVADYSKDILTTLACASVCYGLYQLNKPVE